MKKKFFVSIFTVFISYTLFSMDFNTDLKNYSISFDPLTIVGLFTGLAFPTDAESGEIDFRNMWFAADINWEAESQKELGMGIFLRGDRIAFTRLYRSFYNKERQSGFFWGLYGLVEWRRMHWFIDEDSDIIIGWAFPFDGRDNIYHSIGITGGFDIGFRYRKNNLGITPFLGVGIPLFFCFGDLPPKSYTKEFYLTNLAIRAIHIGIRLDFFQ
jgi:hypothetical protein